jgi:protein tyrosine/serine phosphatase
MTIVDRVVPFSTVFNFRDLGGYPTVDGRTVRWGRVYRSDGLFRLTEEDFEGFAALGIRVVLDLRRPDELDADGRVAESLGLEYHHVNFYADLWPPFELGAEEMPRYLADRYAEMAETGLTGANVVGAALRLLAGTDATPLVFHCAAGKDRTGVLAALTLGLLGVPDDAIADDYALSSDAERRFRAWRRGLSADEPGEAGHASPWILNPCPREAMLLFLAELRGRHGSVDAYVRRAGLTGAEVATLRERLVT